MAKQRFFGELPQFPVGYPFTGRKPRSLLSAAGVHRPPQAGAWCNRGVGLNHRQQS
jgi:hypothetical protein